MNVPNALTLLRIFLVPLLVVLLLTKGPAREYLALGVFLLAALTDFVDGYWARKYQKVTRLGILLDPIADKLLVSAALISLVDLQEADAWAVCIIIGREFAVSGLRSIASGRGIVIPASNWGKAKMFTQIAAVSCLILALRHQWFEVPGRAALWLVVAVALISGTEYFVRFWKRVTEDAPAPQAEERHPKTEAGAR